MSVNIRASAFRMAWVDEQTLVYQWIEPPNPQDSDPVYVPIMVWYNVADYQRVATQQTQQPPVANVYYLQRGSSFITGKFAQDTLSTSQNESFAAAESAFQAAHRIFYNSRFPTDFLLSAQDQCVTQASLINSKFSQTSIDLAAMFTDKECVTYVSV